MGNRTVVVLYNDQTQEWENDPALGKKISIGMNYVGKAFRSTQDDWDLKSNLHYGRVVEMAHADTQTLAVLNGYHFTPIAHHHWFSNEDPDSVELKLLRVAAEKLGYTLRKT